MSETKPRPLLRLASIIACVIATAAGGLAARAQTPSDPDPARFNVEIRAFEAWDRKNSATEHAVLFVGSSSIRLWQTAESFQELPVINRGFGGSHVSDVNRFAQRIVLKYKPRLIVFYAGDNDVAAGKAPRRVFDDFQAFVNLVHNQLPETRIIYLPIKPSLARWKLWPQMQEANALIEQLAQTDDRLQYVDTATPMLGANGEPNAKLFLDDGLHLGEKGYQLWNETLRPVLEERFSSR